MLEYRSRLTIYNAVCPTCKARKGEPCAEKGVIVSLPDERNPVRVLVHQERVYPPDPVK